MMTLILGKKVILVICSLKVTSMCSVKNMQKTAREEAFLTPVPVCTRTDGGRPWTPLCKCKQRHEPHFSTAACLGKDSSCSHMSLLPLAVRPGLAPTAARSLQVRKSHQAPSSVGTCVQTPTDRQGPHMRVPPSLTSQIHIHCNLKISFCLLIYFSFQIAHQKK